MRHSQMPNTSQSKPPPLTTTVPPCPPTASTGRNRNIYVFMSRLGVYAMCCLTDIGVEASGTGQQQMTLWSERPTHPSPARAMPATVPPCPPTASTHPNRSMYAFMSRLGVHVGGVASLTSELRRRGQGSVD